jgi:hypothetical protein
MLQYTLVTWKCSQYPMSVVQLPDSCCDTCKIWLTSEVLLSAKVFIYFKEYSDKEVSRLPYWEFGGDFWYSCKPYGVYDGKGGPLGFNGAAYHSCLQESIGFEWIKCIGSLLHYQQIVELTVPGFTRIYISCLCKRVKQNDDWSSQADGHREEDAKPGK